MYPITAQYLQFLRLRRCTPQTIYGRSRFLARLEADCGLAPIDIDAATLTAWYSRRALTLTPRSQNTELTCARAFYRWAVNQGHRPDDPTLLLARPLTVPGRPRPMPTADVLACVASSTGRIHAGIVCAAYAGMRAIEIAHAEPSWLSPERDTLTIVGKGGRSRVVPAHPLVVSAWLTAGERIFPRYAYRRVGIASPGLVSQAMNKWLHETMGLSDSLHSLRHWYGTQLYRSSRDLRMVQDLMGHSSPQTTAGYADYSRRSASTAVRDLPAA